MKFLQLKYKTLLIAAVVWVSFPTAAQSTTDSEPEQENRTFVERIVTESKGNVEIDIPEKILSDIINDTDSQKKSSGQSQNLRPGINKMNGFRIQVFSDGRNQTTLESRAKARGSAIVAKFPKYRGQVYTFSSSPNWYTRIGNFRNQADANKALEELKRAFPGYSSEMRIVRSPIVIIK